MSKDDKVRKDVSEFYSRSVKQSCGCNCGCSPVLPKGVDESHAGYKAEELEGLPAEAVANSFGCGNPLAFSKVKNGDVVLDLGSGAGIDLIIAAGKTGPSGRVIGVDMTDDMIASAIRNIKQSGFKNIEVRKGIIENLPVEDLSVDWVISNCVINLSPEKEKVFAELARVLKPGGAIAISDIVVKELPEWVRQSDALYSSCVGGAISEEEYLAGLRKAGLVDVEVDERLVYNSTQLKALIESEIPKSVSNCCGQIASSNELVANLATELDGKIWSAKFIGRKP